MPSAWSVPGYGRSGLPPSGPGVCTAETAGEYSVGRSGVGVTPPRSGRGLPPRRSRDVVREIGGAVAIPSASGASGCCNSSPLVDTLRSCG